MKKGRTREGASPAAPNHRGERVPVFTTAESATQKWPEIVVLAPPAVYVTV
jgi:hypothetical protein